MSGAQLREIGGLMERLCTLHETLSRMEADKTDILVRGDVDALTALMNEEQALIMECRSVEARRVSLCTAWGYATLRALMDASVENARQLAPLHARITAAVEEIQRLNARNTRLIETRLAASRQLFEKIGLPDGSADARGLLCTRV